MSQKVFAKGQPITLTQNDFRASGGEGSVFIRNNTAYKIYTDPKKMIPLGKIQELAVLDQPQIIKPLDVLYDAKGAPVGYTMSALSDTYSLCQLFTKAFRDRNNITPDMVMALVHKLQNMVKHIHSKGILIVDLNEMNFLMDQVFLEIYGIDVDSYKTKSFPATAIMPSVEDPHAHRVWSEETDWYSFGIQACQMLVGIHPYKGRHPSIKTMEDRMKANVSIFNKDVQIPGTCQPLDSIPDSLREWMIKVFDKGQRIPPPDAFGAVMVMIPKISHISGSNSYVITQLFDLDGQVLYYLDDVMVTTKAVYVGSTKALPISNAVRIGFTPSMRHPIAARVESGKLRVFDVNKRKELEIDIDAQSLMSIDGRFYIKSGERVYELEVLEMPSGIIVRPKVAGNVLDQATQMFDGIAMQNLLGSMFVSIFATSGTNHQIKIPELNGYRIVDAKYASQVLMVVAEKAGKYDRFIFRFDHEFSSYDTRITSDVSVYGPNFIVLDNGMVLNMLDTDELELFTNKKGAASVKTIADPTIDSDCRLMKHGMTAMFAKDNKVFNFRMK